MSVFRILLMQLASKLKALFLKSVKGNSVQGNLPDGYEEYSSVTDTNGIAITQPSPQYPQKVESVGDKTSNIIDLQGMGVKSASPKTATQSGLTWEVLPNGGLKINGTCTHSSFLYIYFEGDSSSSAASIEKYKNGKKAGTYTIRKSKGNYDGTMEGDGLVYFYFINYRADGSTILSRNLSQNSDVDGTFNLTEDSAYTRMFLRIQKGMTFRDCVLYPMIAEGDAIDDFEPYGYKIPIKVSGKNIYNASVSAGTSRLYVNSSGGKRLTSNTNYQDYFSTDDPNFVMKVNGGETLTFSNSFGAKTVTVATWDQNGNFIARLASATGTVTLDDNVGEIVPYFYSAGAFANVTENDWIQVEFGSQATPYEPYIEPVITNIYLSEPLKKIDDYADVLDFQNQKVIRNITSVNSVTLGAKDSSGKLIKTQCITKTGIRTPLCLSDKYPPNTLEQARLEDYAITNYGALYIRDKDLIDTYSVGDTLDVNIVYVLATPTEEIVDMPQIEVPVGGSVEFLTKIQPSEYEVK